MMREVLLVVVFRWVESLQRHNLRHNRVPEYLAVFQIPHHRLGSLPLCSVVCEDHRTVLASRYRLPDGSALWDRGLRRRCPESHDS